MATLLDRMEQPLMKAAGKLGQQPHLNAIRDGVVGALPLVLIGSLFMIIAQPPLPPALAEAYAKVQLWQVATFWWDWLPHGAQVWLYNHSNLQLLSQPFFMQLLIAQRVLVGLIALYVAFGVAYSLAKRYDLDAVSAGLLSAAGLLLINGMQIVPVDGLPKPIKVIPMDNLGAGGLFMALLIGLLVPEVLKLAKRRKWEIKMPGGVPPAVGRSFSALIPGLLVILPLWLIVHFFGIDLFGLVNTLFAKPVQALSQGGVSVYLVLLAIILIDSVLWLLGVHAVAILAPMSLIWLQNIGLNGDAVAAHQSAQYLNTREALQFFIWVGGSGATVALPFLLLRAKSASLRAIAKVGAIPALFNINEPIIFGVPVMMNARLALPFIVTPIVTMTLTVLAVHFHLVPVPHLVVPWTLPGPIGAFFATGGAWQAAVLSLLNIGLAFLIYWPFVRGLDRSMAADEAK